MNLTNDIKYILKEPWALAPVRGTPDSVGIDLFISKGFDKYVLPPNGLIAIDTGVAFELPKGTFGLIQPRSSAFRNGMMIHGIIDADYRGGVVLQIRNIGPLDLTIEGGKSYAQMLIIPFVSGNLDLSEKLTSTVRDTGGFGSTGNH